MSLAKLEQIAEAEGLNIDIFNLIILRRIDIPGGLYDVIISTVVLMFVDPYTIPDVIENMQSHTAPGGFNLNRSRHSRPEDALCPVELP